MVYVHVHRCVCTRWMHLLYLQTECGEGINIWKDGDKGEVITKAQGLSPVVPTSISLALGPDSTMVFFFFFFLWEYATLPVQRRLFYLHRSITCQYLFLFSPGWGGTMWVKSLAQGLNTVSSSRDYNPQPYDYESNALTSALQC